MAEKIKVTQYDNNIKLIFNLKKNERVESILGATITIDFKNSTTGLVFTRECMVSDSEMAECMYILTSVDTAVAGGYITEMTITYSNNTALTISNPFILVITPQLIL